MAKVHISNEMSPHFSSSKMVAFFLFVFFTLFSNSLTAKHLLLVETDEEIKEDSALTPPGGSGSDYKNRIDPLEFRNIKVENACVGKEEGFPCTTWVSKSRKSCIGLVMKKRTIMRRHASPVHFWLKKFGFKIFSWIYRSWHLTTLRLTIAPDWTQLDFLKEIIKQYCGNVSSSTLQGLEKPSWPKVFRGVLPWEMLDGEDLDQVILNDMFLSCVFFVMPKNGLFKVLVSFWGHWSLIFKKNYILFRLEQPDRHGRSW